MTTEFKTYEKKSKRICGDCLERGLASGWCSFAGECVKRTDPADDCKHYNGKLCQKGGHTRSGY